MLQAAGSIQGASGIGALCARSSTDALAAFELHKMSWMSLHRSSSEQQAFELHNRSGSFAPVGLPVSSRLSSYTADPGVSCPEVFQ